MKTKIVGLIVVLIAICIFISVYTFPKEIISVQKAVVLQEDGSITETTINIAGTLERPIFKPSKFSGELIIDYIPSTKENTLLDLNVTQKNKGINMASLVYYPPSQPLKFEMLGMIWFDDDFKNISIQSTNQWLRNNKNNTEAIKIISPAVSYEQATAVQADLAKKFGTPLMPLKK